MFLQILWARAKVVHLPYKYLATFFLNKFIGGVDNDSQKVVAHVYPFNGNVEPDQ